VLTGKRIERAEVGAPGEFEALPDDELERAIMERLERLGLFHAALICVFQIVRKTRRPSAERTRHARAHAGLPDAHGRKQGTDP
jgi:hypothetical protein